MDCPDELGRLLIGRTSQRSVVPDDRPDLSSAIKQLRRILDFQVQRVFLGISATLTTWNSRFDPQGSP